MPYTSTLLSQRSFVKKKLGARILNIFFFYRYNNRTFSQCYNVCVFLFLNKLDYSFILRYNDREVLFTEARV